MKLPLNPALANLAVYLPGRPIAEVARELNLDPASIIKLASNENPLGPSPKALEAMRHAISSTHLYPDGSAFYLKQKLADKLGVAPANLVLGNGSNEIIEFVGRALLASGDNIVVSQYCFAIYPIIARMMGADVITVPARDYGHDLRVMTRAITPRTKIIFVANPNNPTGTRAPEADVVELINNVPPHVLLVMDEAYIEFLEHPVDLLPLVRRGDFPNLILMRTFSKIFGLAGLRLGYGIGHPDLVLALEKIRQPFNANSLAQAAALAALGDGEHIARTRHINTQGLEFYTLAFRQMGLEFVPSHANFILVRVGDGQRVFNELQKLGVITRSMASYQLPEWVRISVGTAAENTRCLTALRTVLGK